MCINNSSRKAGRVSGILEPGIYVSFVSSSPPPSGYSYKFVGAFSWAQIDEQWDDVLNPMRDKNGGQEPGERRDETCLWPRPEEAGK